MHELPQLLTVGRVATELGVQCDRLQRLLDAHPELQPVARAGTLRVFSRADLPQIKRALCESLQAKPLRRSVLGGGAPHA